MVTCSTRPAIFPISGKLSRSASVAWISIYLLAGAAGALQAEQQSVVSEATQAGSVLSVRDRNALIEKSDQLSRAGLYREFVDTMKILLGDAIARGGLEDEETAQIQYVISVHLAQINEWKTAKLYFDAGAERFLKSYPKGGREHVDATILRAQLDYHLGQYAEALQSYQEALALVENLFGKRSAAASAQRVSIAVVLLKLRRYAEAVTHLELAYDIEVDLFGKDHRTPKDTLRQLKVAQQGASLKAIAEASPAVTRDLSRKIRLDESMDAESRVNAASTEAVQSVKMGEIIAGVEALEMAIELCRSQLGDDHPATASTMVNLAMLFRMRAEYGRAEQLWSEALQLRIRTVGRDHPDTASVLNHLGSLALTRRDFPQAEMHLTETLLIREKRLGESHALTAESRNNLGVLFSTMQKFDDAMPLLEKALAFFEANPDQATAELVVTARANLAVCRLHQGDAKKARDELILALASLKLLGEDAPVLKQANLLHNIGASFHLLGDFDAARQHLGDSLKMRAQIEGEQQTLDRVPTLQQAAMVAMDRKDREVARELAEEALAISQKAFSELDFQADADAALRFARLSNPLALIASLDDPEEIALAALFWKNRIFDTLLSANRAVPASSPEETSQPVSASLREGEMFLDYLSYDRYVGKSQFEAHYGVLVHGKNSTLPRWVDLGPSEAIDDLIAKYGNGVRGGSDADLEASCRELYEAVLLTVLGDVLGGTTELPATIFLSTDARLSVISFATLLSSTDRFAGQDSRFIYLGSARDMPKVKAAEFTAIELRSGRAIFLGDPVFGDAPADSPVQLAPLPGTRQEVEGIAKIAADGGMEVSAFLGDEASERNFRVNCEHAEVIHLATHALGETDRTVKLLGMENFAGLGAVPPSRTYAIDGGIALAGASESLGEGGIRDRNSDRAAGWLTPSDFRGLDLSATRLMVLSACDTGLGTVIRGEGVFGLRRAAQLAGVENVLISLWPIPDEETSVLMQEFYAELFEQQQQSGVGLFLQAQARMMEGIRERLGIAAAVRRAGGFIWVSGAK